MLLKLLQYLVTSVVNEPEKIKIEHTETPQMDLFCLSVAKRDLGRLLGRKGRTVEAIRDLMTAAGVKLEKEVVIDVVE